MHTLAMEKWSWSRRKRWKTSNRLQHFTGIILRRKYCKLIFHPSLSESQPFINWDFDLRIQKIGSHYRVFKRISPNWKGIQSIFTWELTVAEATLAIPVLSKTRRWHHNTRLGSTSAARWEELQWLAEVCLSCSVDWAFVLLIFCTVKQTTRSTSSSWTVGAGLVATIITCQIRQLVLCTSMKLRTW